MIETLYPVFVALCFNGVDLATGIIASIKNKDLESAKLRDGLFKKVAFIAVYFLAWLVDTQGGRVGFNLGVNVLTTVIFYVVGTEIISIIENISKINPDLLPEKLMELFHITSKEE